MVTELERSRRSSALTDRPPHELGPIRLQVRGLKNTPELPHFSGPLRLRTFRPERGRRVECQAFYSEPALLSLHVVPFAAGHRRRLAERHLPRALPRRLGTP